MTDLRHERRHLSHEIYQLPVTAERKHTDQIRHGTADVFVLPGIFRLLAGEYFDSTTIFSGFPAFSCKTKWTSQSYSKWLRPALS